MILVQVSAFTDRYGAEQPPANSATIVLGEKVRVYGQVTATGGTLTFSVGTPPTFQLLDAETEQPVTGFTDPVPVTASDSGSAAQITSDYLLDTAGLEPGFYQAVLALTATGSDGQTATYLAMLHLKIVRSL